MPPRGTRCFGAACGRIAFWWRRWRANWLAISSLKYAGRGPFAPSLWDFLRCYGPAQGAHAFAVYRVIEARSRPRPGGAYLYGIDVLKPWRGHRRGRDVGGALIEAAIAATARLGLRTLDLEVRRPAARALFLRMGAVPVTAPRLSFTGLLIASAGDYQRLTIGVPRA